MSESNGTPLDPQTFISTEPPAAQVIQLGQPITIELSGQIIRVMKRPDGERSIIVGPVTILFAIPLNDESAKLVARELVGGIEIAPTLPRHLRGV